MTNPGGAGEAARQRASRRAAVGSAAWDANLNVHRVRVEHVVGPGGVAGRVPLQSVQEVGPPGLADLDELVRHVARRHLRKVPLPARARQERRRRARWAAASRRCLTASARQGRTRTSRMQHGAAPQLPQSSRQNCDCVRVPQCWAPAPRTTASTQMATATSAVAAPRVRQRDGAADPGKFGSGGRGRPMARPVPRPLLLVLSSPAPRRAPWAGHGKMGRLAAGP
jgi:hypothetical protein